MDLKCQVPWISWEFLISMLCMCCTDKCISLNLDLFIFGNFVLIMIMLMTICIHVCMYVLVSHGYHGSCLFYANVYIYIHMHECHYIT